jgi:hypothetical protein
MSYPTLLPTIGNEIAEEIDDELKRAERHGVEFASLHEAWAVIWEEVREVETLMLMKRKNRDREAIRKELVQVAAMAIKAIKSMDNFVGGSV